MLDHLILMISLLGSGHVGTGTIFGSSRWDRSNPHSRLACLRRDIDDKNDMIIAHNTLPCGQRVWIFNPRTGLSVVATVEDRGPRHAYADLALPVAHAISHNGKEPILLVPLPTPGRVRGETIATRLVPAAVEETWEVANPVREVPLTGRRDEAPNDAGLIALLPTHEEPAVPSAQANTDDKELVAGSDVVADATSEDPAWVTFDPSHQADLEPPQTRRAPREEKSAEINEADDDLPRGSPMATPSATTNTPHAWPSPAFVPATTR